jgi:hypothetical protein
MSAPPTDSAPTATIVRPPEGLARGRFATSGPVLVGAAAALFAVAIGLTVHWLRLKRRTAR